jgi:hypothetical protein
MPRPNEHTCDIKSTENYNVVGQQTRGHDGKEYRILLGKPKSGGGSEELTYYYPKDAWDKSSAQTHCKNHGGKFYQATNMAELVYPDEAGDTGEILGQPVAVTGKWKGHDFTEEDLDEMVDYFNNLSETEKRNTYVKLGHGDQSIVHNSGLVSVGWVKRLWRKGKELFSDLTAVPRMVLRMVKNKTLKECSPEVGINFTDVSTGKTYKKIIDAVALLPWGSSKHKAMKTLKDLSSLYADEGDSVDIGEGVLVLNMSETTYMSETEKIENEPENKGKNPPQKEKNKNSKKEEYMEELEKVKKEKEELEKKLKTETEKYSEDLSSSKKEVEKLSEEVKTKDKELQELKEKEREGEVEVWMAERENQMTPAIEPLVKALLLCKEDKKIVSFAEKDKEDMSVAETVKELVENLPEDIVDFTEHSEEEEAEERDSRKVTDDEDENDRKQFKKIKKYQEDHKLETFTEAADAMASEGKL